MRNVNLSVPAGPGFGGANLVEMKRDELLNINGGLVWYAALGVGVAIAAVAEVIRDWDNFKAGLSGSCES